MFEEFRNEAGHCIFGRLPIGHWFFFPGSLIPMKKIGEFQVQTEHSKFSIGADERVVPLAFLKVQVYRGNGDVREEVCGVQIGRYTVEVES